MILRIGEVCLQTGDVVRLAGFYRWLLGVGGENDDSVHQVVLAEETALTVHNDGTAKNNQNQNISVAFAVPDVDTEYARLLEHGVTVIDPPMMRPWGAKNVRFLDPDGNTVYFRSILSAQKTSE